VKIRSRKVILAVVATIAFCVGVWLLVLPSLNRQSDIDQQEELLDSILAVMDSNMAEICVEEPPAFSMATFDIDEFEAFAFYDFDPKFEPTPYYVEVYEMPQTTVHEPIDPAVFPSGIEGIGILTIESIDLRLPIKEGVEEPALRIAPGRVTQTATIGEVGNAVIAGHRNFTFGSMFNRLGEVEIGDIVEFQAMSGEITAFEVFELLVITPDNQIAFIQPQDEAIITLYTCTPIREATHRLLIRARKIEGGL